ncbi:hypothetical protein AG1IA_07417 [Rhizoctonia solani AG-1 IA]|uniref:Uncharacterized protein n=1 Tax=Thanatephorus cucumeris (strain AG1-IA) TaxID=983506 RepID=L8WQE9_THACA|nr:hypothetical protein AG1IA_07417 [Rhizoctonia solani AG-1 IA]
MEAYLIPATGPGRGTRGYNYYCQGMGHVDFFSSTAMENNQQSGKLTTQQSGEGDIDRKSVGDIENPPVATNAEASQGQYLTGAKVSIVLDYMSLTDYLGIVGVSIRVCMNY